MRNFIELLTDISNRPFDITTTAAGASQINQTQRNKLKREVMASLGEALSQVFENSAMNVYMTDKGVAIEVPNTNIADAYDGVGSGAITMVLDLKIQSLDVDATVEADLYAEDMAAKAEAARQAELKKQEKIAKSEAARAARMASKKAKA